MSGPGRHRPEATGRRPLARLASRRPARLAVLRPARLVLVGAVVLAVVVGGIGWRALRPPQARDMAPLAASSPSVTAAGPTPTESPSPSGTPTPTPPPTTTHTSSPPHDQPSLVGDTANAWAFAPLSDPSHVTIEGSVPSQRAWSTSKVLVTAAYLQTVVGGDPSQLSAEQRDVITKALTESDGTSITWLHEAIPGGSGEPVNAILRSIGDDQTVWPNSAMNSATWTIDRQLSFLIALHQGRVVNPSVSAFLISMMQPVSSERWGLGTVGASAFKGGWVSAETETRQMGYLDGYAVVIITAGEGPVVQQIDGDSAHVEQMNHLAALLKQRLTP